LFIYVYILIYAWSTPTLRLDVYITIHELDHRFLHSGWIFSFKHSANNRPPCLLEVSPSWLV